LIGAPGEIPSALRASSLRDRRRFASASNLACGQVIEIALSISGVRIGDDKLRKSLDGFRTLGKWRAKGDESGHWNFAISLYP
jgi:hypothetical protein